MKSKVLVIVALLAFGVQMPETIIAAAPERAVMDNGAVVWLLPVAGVKQVAVESVYEIGFLYEPAGMTQASHLLEHLVCFGATKRYRANESFRRINEIGLANAETLADWTHFDFIVPADQLELVLQIEAERLASLQFDEAQIRAEAKRCYRETDAVEQQPSAGMLKHAMMACSQAWRHGETSALVRGGLEEMSVDQLAAFHQSHYRPDRLTLVIFGDFDKASALAFVKKYIGTIPVRPARFPTTTDWTKAPKRHTIKWDAGVRSVCIAYPPPENSRDAAVLSLFGVHLFQQLRQNAQLQEMTDATFCSMPQWRVGTLPFFVYAAVKEGQALDAVEKELEASVAQSIRSASEALRVVKLSARQLEMQASTWDRVTMEEQARQLARIRSIEQKQALAMILGQAAVNWGTFSRLTGPQPQKMLNPIQSLTAARFRDILKASLDNDRKLVTWIVPLGNP